MSTQYDVEDDDSLWGEQLPNKQRNKRVKQRRRDTKRRYNDDAAEMDYARDHKWK